MNALDLLLRLIDFYELLIIAYIIMSWFRPTDGLLLDAYRTLGTVVEPWLSIFRRIIPPIGMIDISPIVAFLALGAISSLLARLLG